ncbi:PepSY domain-containing protein [Carboxylicivirga taeanensis]|uniref:PepSY-associated TM helix domain-containing protein n=1 Tax=Carboxylicivirga taeanensis TaxID=1416875 RepID=UPI003F6E20DD
MNKKNKAAKLYKKLHKWPGLIISFLLLYYAVTGIFMNHRETFSNIDVPRNLLPKEFNYSNWNNGALKGNLIIQPDSILIYGNVGVWACDSSFQQYHSLNSGFPKGADNRKIFDLHRSSDGHLYAATQFGLYAFNQQVQVWQKLEINTDIKRFVAVESIDDTIYALNRSYLFKGRSDGIHTNLEKIELVEPLHHQNQVSLFETIWQLHSGEIMGLPGKLFVDLLGLITIFLSLSGIVYFLFPGWIKRRKKANRSVTKLAQVNRWSLKWHNKTGAWLFICLSLLFFTGMFLRPPLLIAIAYSKVPPIKWSHLDQTNPWYDKLRDLKYNPSSESFILATSDGLFQMTSTDLSLERFRIQPPVSVMGINVLEPYDSGAYLIGSFSGLFLWHPAHPQIHNYITGRAYVGNTGGRPIGDFKITGLLKGVNGEQYLIDYDKGALPLYHNVPFAPMPDNILKTAHMSLWNLSLEIHTGRFFRFMLGNFYILLVPLSGLISIMVVISGYLLWKKRFKKVKLG